MEKEETLNLILDEELEFCNEFENLLMCKKEAIIHRQIDKLEQFDEKILECQTRLKLIIEKRQSVNQMFGDKNIKLVDIIKSIEDKSVVETLKTKQKRLQNVAKKIDLINQTVASLIEYSLKILDGSVIAIAKALSPNDANSDCYNLYGQKSDNIRLSSLIIEDA